MSDSEGREGHHEVLLAGPLEGALIRLHASLAVSPWRIAPAWSALAGAIAVGADLFAPSELLWLGVIVALVDPVLGLLRRSAAPVPQEATLADVPSIAPFMQPGSPLGRLLKRLPGAPAAPTEVSGALSAAWQAPAIGLAVACSLSWVLGPVALALLPTALVAVVLAGMATGSGRRPALCQSWLDVAMPWALGAGFFAVRAGGPLLAEGRWMALAAGFTVLQWGVWRARLSGGSSTGGVWAGSVAVLVALVAFRSPVALVMTAPLLGAPAWRLSLAGRSRIADLQWCMPFWWAAMLISATIAR